MTFDLKSYFAFPLCIFHILIQIIIFLLAKPVYEKLAWENFSSIGSDLFMQEAFKYYEIAKGTMVTLMVVSLPHFGFMIFFEKNIILTVSYILLLLLFMTIIYFAYNSVFII